MADPIAALKALVDSSKLKTGEEAAAEYLFKVNFMCLYLDISQDLHAYLT